MVSLFFLTQLMPIEDLEILFPTSRTQLQKLPQSESTKLNESSGWTTILDPKYAFFFSHFSSVIPFPFLVFFPRYSTHSCALGKGGEWGKHIWFVCTLSTHKKTIKYFKLKSIIFISIDFCKFYLSFVNQKQVEWH